MSNLDLISIKNINPEQNQSLINNENTGIEYEFATWYILSNNEDRDKISNLIFEHHKSKKNIYKIISQIDESALIDAFRKKFKTGFEPFFSTQDDTVGPSDIVLLNNNIGHLGISVKYSNDCSLNLSSRYFLSEQDIKGLSEQLYVYCRKYIIKMNKLYGKPKYWFRKRKGSEITNEYIDLLRDKVINNWNHFDSEKKQKILKKVYHNDSLIDFVVLKYEKNKDKLSFKIFKGKFDFDDIDNVRIEKKAGHLIAFYYNEYLFGKMQVKFNNGILEKPQKNKYDFEVNGILMKMGDPFGSWNFSIE